MSRARISRASSRALVVAAFVLASTLLRAEVAISEIMYDPPAGNEYEYVEVHNTGSSPADLTGWMFSKGILFAFPAGASIPAGGYAVVARSKEKLLAAYPGLSSDLVFGDYGGGLDNDGERLELGPASDPSRVSATYRDRYPWDVLAAGLGASLERICFDESSDPNVAESWRAGAVPPSGGHGGSPGAPGPIATCPPVPPAPGDVVISEVMFHPVLEDALEDFHEFIEITNRGAAAADLTGWRIAGGIDFSFAPGTSIPAGGRIAVAKDRAKLLEVVAYGLTEADVLGNYDRELDNGGDKIVLIDGEGRESDAVAYDDDFPWPEACDALGAQEEWLRADLLPLENHRYRGHSLERVSLELPGGAVWNWAPSPLDGPTPARPNASARAKPLPVVTDIVTAAAAGGDDPLIRADQAVLVQARFEPAAPSGAVTLEWFVDDIAVADEPTTRVAMYDDGTSGGDLIAQDGVFTATLEGHPDNSIVRYRILADRGSGEERISPRPSDPNEWHAYFVSPVIDTTTRVYQVFINPVNWGKMWTGIQGGRVTGCAPSATWDAQYPAVFVYQGKVIDARVRYQGSRWNRTNGPNIATWPYPKPQGGPNPLRALSWRIAFPRYSQLEGYGEVVLNKLTQGCPGYNAGVSYRLFEMADLPGSLTRFIRFHVNGGYYHYMIELERPGEEMMRRYHKWMSEKHPELPRERVGHLFKSAGCNCDEGPYGWGDERPLAPSCGHSSEVRYSYTYDRKTHSWDSYAELGKLFDGLFQARKVGGQALRDFLEESFDLDLLLNYVAIMNYSVPFDDMFQNHFLYQRLSDKKWIVFPWDQDQNFGEWKPATASFYMGEQGDPDNRSAWWNYLKDAVLKAYRPEFEERLILLNNTILHPDVIAKLVDDVTAVANPAEAAKAPAGLQCSFPGRATTFKQFAVTRYNLINSKLAGVDVDAGPDQTVFAGSPVQLDGSASKPDIGPDVTYVWSNGLEGEKPVVTFTDPGDHVLTLTVTARGIQFSDEVTIHVIPVPQLAFQESGGQVVMEAESFTWNERHASPTVWWDSAAESPGYSGLSYMKAMETKRTTFLQTGYSQKAPELRFAIVFESPGAYRVWIRALSAETAADSCYVGLDGTERATKLAHQFTVDPGFVWSGGTRTEGPQELLVNKAGLHLFSIWMRESGQIIDKVILTKDTALTPDGIGPEESGKSQVGEAKRFIRGDSDESGEVNLTDVVVVLSFLFQGGPEPPCSKAGDVDDSGVLQITDAIVLLNHLFKGGGPPAAPYPEAGADTTPDELGCR